MVSVKQTFLVIIVFCSLFQYRMSFADFIKYYDKLEICHLGPDSAKSVGNANNWEGRTEKGCWLKGSSAGGCRNFLNTFAMNPQYRYC